EAARMQAEENRRREEERRAREEAARLEAIRHAEVEKARVEAEQRARLEAMAAQQQHERKLAELQQDESKKKLRKTLIGVVVGVLVVGGVATAIGVTSWQNSQEQIARKDREFRELEEQKKKAEADAKAQQAKIDSLLDQVKSAKDEATRLALQK